MSFRPEAHVAAPVAPTQPLMRLQFALTPAEFERADLARDLIKLRARATWLAPMLVVVLGISAFEYLLFRQSSGLEIPIWTGIFIAIWIVTFVSLRTFNRKNRGSQPETTIDIWPDVIDVYSAAGQWRAPWNAFSRLHETSALFVLPHPQTGMQVVIPKRALQSEQRVEWLRAFIASRQPG